MYLTGGFEPVNRGVDEPERSGAAFRYLLFSRSQFFNLDVSWVGKLERRSGTYYLAGASV